MFAMGLDWLLRDYIQTNFNLLHKESVRRETSQHCCFFWMFDLYNLCVCCVQYLKKDVQGKQHVVANIQFRAFETCIIDFSWGYNIYAARRECVIRCIGLFSAFSRTLWKCSIKNVYGAKTLSGNKSFSSLTTDSARATSICSTFHSRLRHSDRPSSTPR